ncbi:hypothetical protein METBISCDRAFT_12925 [Metschnikowia bicuspidata]|uniref:Transcription initiation factor TFIID subunit 1 histone acetyltransferase domain-containing protein n=1 Tax=Metschnikowia bicuspidata TaxID=27322 RepID=A0A4P9ZG81_9ASCO|nr:hypothetical protein METBISCDRAFT_12925 [Metschnikowia bicuspidata]
MSSHKKSHSFEDLTGALVPDGVDVPDDKLIDDIYAEKVTKHAADAIDYEDIDELADDELPEKETPHATEDGPQPLQPQYLQLEEQDQQVVADNEFDNIFGGDDLEDADNANQDSYLDAIGDSGLGSAHGFHDFSVSAGFEDDGLHDMGLGFEDEDDYIQSAAAQKANKNKSPEEIAARTKKLRKVVQDLETSYKSRMLAKYFPQYRKDKMFNFNTIVLLECKFYGYKRPAIARRSHQKSLLPLKLTLEMEPDQRKAFKSKKGIDSAHFVIKGIRTVTAEDMDLIRDLQSKSDLLSRIEMVPLLKQDGDESDKFSEFDKNLILATADWDDKNIISAGESDDELPRKLSQISEKFEPEEISYDDEDIFNGNVARETLQLNMNDPNLLFVPATKREDNAKSKAIIPTDNKLLQMKFNISNDKEYEILTNNYNAKVRSQLSNLNIEHSVPALRLQTPYYKIKLTKEEARAFHRPRFQVRQGLLICFSKLKVRKKKKDRGKTAKEIFRRTSDLTTVDTSTLIGMEYCEEDPHILSNFGMGSKIINYYRKEKEEDSSRPKAPIGETHVLGVEDKSPFWSFGHVAKGDFVPTLYNNMMRAPIFKQESKQTDFLLIRSQGCGNHQKYYLRAIDHLFAVGNVFPAVEVPAPHSRKVTNTSKNRLKMIVFRTMNKNGNGRLAVKDIALHFPDQNDMQNRQRLKEFMEYIRKGDDQNYWKIKGVDTAPSEEEIKTMISPEDATLLDCMQHGQQALDDIDSLFNDDSKKYDVKKRKEEREKEDKEDDEKKDGEKKRKEKDVDMDESIDEGLTPWSSSRNFIIANQTKVMLQLNGEGDPSGIGLGFSLIRATQKHGFKPLIPPTKESVPKVTNASYQQKLYENEINRIWYAQRSSLTVDDTEGHTLDDLYKEYKPIVHLDYMKQKIEKEREDKIKNEGLQAANQNVLKITRHVRDQNNIVQRKVEYVYDPRLIKAYIKKKKQIEGDKMSIADVNEIIPTNDAEMNKIRRKALEEKIANLTKRAKLSKGRKPTKDPIHLAAAAGGKIINANTVLLPNGLYAIGGKGIGKGKSKTRRCASCGAFGHIRTNKSCPLYSHTKGGTVQIPQEQKDILLAGVRDQKAGVETTSASPTVPPETPGATPSGANHAVKEEPLGVSSE